jgi:S-adenosylmethionine synthetase
MSFRISLLATSPPHALPLEIVERKGLGHPDTICDAVAEAFSRGLSRFYLERFGYILHHNVDKALLCGGVARPAFGAGEVLEPIEIHLAGRATCEYRGIRIPVADIAVESARRWLQENLLHLDANAQVRIVPHIRPTSPDLSDLFDRATGADSPLANDTSFGVGFAPLDTLESTVLAIAQDLNVRGTRAAHPFIGEDIKVMGARIGANIDVTIACAIVGRHTASLDEYHARKSVIRERARQIAETRPAGIAGAAVDKITVNAADGTTAESVYLTVTGLSAEAGDDGQVGRGNRVNGLITPYRPMSLEAAAGKNPVTHVGKLYNVMAHRVAHAIVAEVPEVQEAYCYLLSRIGHPITDPLLFDVHVRLAEPGRLDNLTPLIADAARTAFSGIGSVGRDALNDTLQLW